MSLLRPIYTGLAAGSYGTEMEGAALAAGVHGFPVVLTSFVGQRLSAACAKHGQ